VLDVRCSLIFLSLNSQPSTSFTSLAPGHDVPEADIRRRFKRSLVHLPADYLPLATRWAVWDNRGLPAKQLAFSATHGIDFVRQLIAV
jgi:predicted ABC-type ATPase